MLRHLFHLAGPPFPSLGGKGLPACVIGLCVTLPRPDITGYLRHTPSAYPPCTPRLITPDSSTCAVPRAKMDLHSAGRPARSAACPRLQVPAAREGSGGHHVGALAVSERATMSPCHHAMVVPVCSIHDSRGFLVQRR